MWNNVEVEVRMTDEGGCRKEADQARRRRSRGGARDILMEQLTPLCYVGGQVS